MQKSKILQELRCAAIRMQKFNTSTWLIIYDKWAVKSKMEFIQRRKRPINRFCRHQKNSQMSDEIENLQRQYCVVNSKNILLQLCYTFNSFAYKQNRISMGAASILLYTCTCCIATFFTFFSLNFFLKNLVTSCDYNGVISDIHTGTHLWQWQVCLYT